MEEVISSLILSAATKYPIVTSIFVIIGVMRAVNKPFFSFLRSLVKETATDVDDRILDTVEQSPLYRGLTWVLDWTTSIKLPKKQVVVPVAVVVDAPVEEKKPETPRGA